jgi:flagellar hook protein FlgE
MALSNFSASVLGMDSQAHSLSQVSANVANVNTVGYKSVETLFKTVAGDTGAQNSKAGVFGVFASDRTSIEMQGYLNYTGQPYDVAINNPQGMFVLEESLSGSDTFFTRAGDFVPLVIGSGEESETYLGTNGGMYVQGYQADAEGNFSNNLGPIRIDPSYVSDAVPTTDIDIRANIPTDGGAVIKFSTYGNGELSNTVSMNFEETSVANIYELTITSENGTVNPSDPIEVRFGPEGNIVSPSNVDVAASWNDGTSNTVNVDLTEITQMGSEKIIHGIDNDGRPEGKLMGTKVDKDGILVAQYSNGELGALGKIAVANFESPENLEQVTGTLFRVTDKTGDINYMQDANSVGSDFVIPNALEMSNVDLNEEFTKMIQVQRAYSSNATTFKTHDELLEALIQLKT